MKEVKKDWNEFYKLKSHRKMDREIRDLDVLDRNVTRILSDCFKTRQLVLEAGCGTGIFCFWLQKKGINTLGIDFIPQAITGAAGYGKAVGSEAMFVIGDVSKLPLRGDSLDGYVSLGVIEHFRSIADLSQSLRECRRVLKSGGRAIILIPNIFVPLRNRLLLLTSKKMGLFHEFYTINDVYAFGRIIGPNSKMEILDIWSPIYNVIDGILRRLGINEALLRKMRLAFTRLPQLPLLKYFLGYICLTVDKP